MSTGKFIKKKVLAFFVPCPVCEGKGTIKFVVNIPCPRCNGYGHRYYYPSKEEVRTWLETQS